MILHYSHIKPAEYIKYLSPLLVLMTLVILLLASRSPQSKTSPVDTSILYQQACRFPCWNGLVPGRTTLQTAQSAIHNIPFVADARWGIGESDSNGRHYIGLGEWDSGVGLRFEEGVLRVIDIHPNIKFTLGDFVTRFGKPDGWTIDHDFGGGEVTWSHVTLRLFYVRYGLVSEFLIFHGLPKSIFTLEPSAKGLQFWLVPASSSFSNMLMGPDWWLSEENAIQIVNEKFQTSWPGLNAQFKSVNPFEEYMMNPRSTFNPVIPPLMVMPTATAAS